MATPRLPSACSTARPLTISTTMLSRMCAKPAWISVALSGVSHTGRIGGASGGNTTCAPISPGTNPPLIAARPTRSSRIRITETRVVKATSDQVAGASRHSGPNFSPISDMPSPVRSDELDLRDEIIAIAGRHRDLDLAGDLATDQRAAERRVVRDAPTLGIRLGLSDYLVLDRLFVLGEQGDGRAEHALVARQLGRVDDQRAAELVLDIGDRRLDLALALLGGEIFGVFRQVAMGARFLDRIDDQRTLRFQTTQISSELFVPLSQHRHLLDGRHPSS